MYACMCVNCACYPMVVGVAGNEIGDDGAASLSEALKCCSELREAYLRGELLRAAVRVVVTEVE